jgi:hypothetical protein
MRRGLWLLRIGRAQRCRGLKNRRCERFAATFCSKLRSRGGKLVTFSDGSPGREFGFDERVLAGVDLGQQFVDAGLHLCLLKRVCVLRTAGWRGLAAGEPARTRDWAASPRCRRLSQHSGRPWSEGLRGCALSRRRASQGMTGAKLRASAAMWGFDVAHIGDTWIGFLALQRKDGRGHAPPAIVIRSTSSSSSCG